MNQPPISNGKSMKRNYYLHVSLLTDAETSPYGNSYLKFSLEGKSDPKEYFNSIRGKWHRMLEKGNGALVIEAPYHPPSNNHVEYYFEAMAYPASIIKCIDLMYEEVEK